MKSSPQPFISYLSLLQNLKWLICSKAVSLSLKRNTRTTVRDGIYKPILRQE